jgi:hypothetical protein
MARHGNHCLLEVELGGHRNGHSPHYEQDLDHDHLYHHNLESGIGVLVVVPGFDSGQRHEYSSEAWRFLGLK